MSESKYKCETPGIHDLFTAYPLATSCPGCEKAFREKYKTMLAFINKLAFDSHDYENENEILWDATELLREIGEIE